jgi:hypothetical protein
MQRGVVVGGVEISTASSTLIAHGQRPRGIPSQRRPCDHALMTTATTQQDAPPFVGRWSTIVLKNRKIKYFDVFSTFCA